jgi:hypothetical protein
MLGQMFGDNPSFDVGRTSSGIVNEHGYRFVLIKGFLGRDYLCCDAEHKKGDNYHAFCPATCFHGVLLVKLGSPEEPLLTYPGLCNVLLKVHP